MKVNKDGLTEEEFLANYKPTDYERPSVTVDMMIMGMNKSLDNLKLLLIKRGNHPYMDCWALPGGFVEINESAYDAACRELEEETGLTNIYMEQVYTFSQPNRDPRMRVIDIAYMALTPIVDVKAGDDAKEAVWFDVEFTQNTLKLSNAERGLSLEYELTEKTFVNGNLTIKSFVPNLVSKDSLAFDHVEIVLEGLTRLRNKVEYTDLAFSLMNEEFTLTDLQRVYEIILGKPLFKTNFRNKIATKVEELDKKGQSIVGRKSARLYRLKR